jgi:hypothetical protein
MNARRLFGWLVLLCAPAACATGELTDGDSQSDTSTAGDAGSDQAPGDAGVGLDATSPRPDAAPATDGSKPSATGEAGGDAHDPCVPQVACAPGQCGTAPDGCGGTLQCAGCTGKAFCNAASACEACTLFGNMNTGCPGATPQDWICTKPPADTACVFMVGLQYCCP